MPTISTPRHLLLPNPHDSHWELRILDPEPGQRHIHSLAVGDIDGDGRVEAVLGGSRHLLWHRPSTGERGIIAEGCWHVGVLLVDVDGDGGLDIIAGDLAGRTMYWFERSPDGRWLPHLIDDDALGGAHDLVWADIDGDGACELLASAVYCPLPGLVAYKPGTDPRQPWRRHVLQRGRVEEGLCVADLDGDGRLEVVNGPNWYARPADGAWSAPWVRHEWAPGFREMCRTAAVEIAGSGRPDLVITDSEYLDGRLSWFENRLNQAGPSWIEHPIDDHLYYSHTLNARMAPGGGFELLVAEMRQGGWLRHANADSRIMLYRSADRGRTWERVVVDRGEGTHEAELVDVDGDGVAEIMGKDAFEAPNDGPQRHPKIHLWKHQPGPAPFSHFRHRFIDRDKATTAVDLVWCDVDGDGAMDICAADAWYAGPSFERFEIPGIFQVLAAADIDGDGRDELIALTPRPGAPADDWYAKLHSELVWLKPIDPRNGRWEQHRIGTGCGDWPHGCAIGPILPGGRLALITAYHSSHNGCPQHQPELWEVPADPRQPWPCRRLADIVYGEELTIVDLDGDGRLDILAGCWWLHNVGDGTFTPHRLLALDDFPSARQAVGDLDGNGRPIVVLGEENVDWKNRLMSRCRVVICRPGDDPQQPWHHEIIDRVRCPHSVGLGDLDGDGRPEIVVGEHDPFEPPYRTRCRLFVYKAVPGVDRAWSRYTLDDRFEHHDGAKVVRLDDGRPGILSHGWNERLYLHLWSPASE